MVPTDDVDPPSALPRGTRLGEFEIRRVLGIGGFGIVYLAFDHALEREVAVKEYMPASLAGRTANLQVSLLSQAHAETFALGLRSFVNEARLLARFDHPSLVKVHRYWEENATAYMAMPLYAGDNLHKVRQHMTQPPDEAWLRPLLDPLLGAIEQLHEAAVFHRDISPDNVILQPDGRPVLLDFGAARRVIGDKSMALTAILKPAYAPIEQYAEAGTVKQGPWTDLYSLGATLHYLLLGRAPSPSTARAVQDDSVPLAMGNLPGCSPAFLRCIDWMLQPRPNDRPQSVAQLRQALTGRAEVPDASAGAWARTQRVMPDAEATVVMPRPVSQPPQRPVNPELDSTLLLVPAERPGPSSAALPGLAADPATTHQPASAHRGAVEPSAAELAAAAQRLVPPGAGPVDAGTPSAEIPALAPGASGPDLVINEPDLAVSADPSGPAGARRQRPSAGRWAALAAVGAAGVLAAWLGLRPGSPTDAATSAAAKPSPAAAARADGAGSMPGGANRPAALVVPAGPGGASTRPDGATAAVPATGGAPAAASTGADPRTAVANGTAPAPATADSPAAGAAGRAAGSGQAAAGTAPAPRAAAGEAVRVNDPARAGAGQPMAATAAVPAKPAAKPAPAGKDNPRDAVAAAPAAMPFKLPPPSTSTIVSPAPTANPPSNMLSGTAGGHSAPGTTASPAPSLPPMPTPAVTGPVAAVAEPVKPVVMATPAPPTPVAATTATPAYTAPAAAATPSPAPQRPAVREPDPMVHARALSPSERCEGRSLVTYNSCIETQCRAAELRDHPECVKARREQEQRGGNRF